LIGVRFVRAVVDGRLDVSASAALVGAANFNPVAGIAVVALLGPFADVGIRPTGFGSN
jgi:hypothetical protein